MMYYRRKILLSILEAFGGKLTRTQMQKLAFVLTRWQEQKSFDFVPYKYGCFSFQANQDLLTLSKQGIIQEENIAGYNYWFKKDKVSYRVQLQSKDRELVARLSLQFKDYNQEDLIRFTYLNFPFYATNSTIAKKYLSTEELKKVYDEKRTYTEKRLFTIGYEGISLETYLNKLLVNDIKLLCDVRKNSFSMKYGFSKKQLQNACEQVGIFFHHIPELGIESNKRKELKIQKDYDVLFEEYECTTLIANQASLEELTAQFEKYPRIAITCFEANHCMCHRSSVAKTLQKLPEWDIPITHL